ncbi:glycoside hydrolase family 18 protein [Amniculicola lignicola CBS 123094]|uniref:Glycoside hydrolase family 18 protein n=1 Tax=Amniculicola lignicola CBS 123094 TaxID=1392246 RepID=A0A6A5WBL8_9PLEO|nr:glycoside hydrolase family 18 protein [Amniculicola lignicola CBS 123094]
MPPVPKFLPQAQGPRLVVYAQTFHQDGTYISLLPLLTSNTGITHVIIAAIHINEDPNGLTLNDHSPDHEVFRQLWGEVRWLQGGGVKVMGMLGGAAKGSYGRLGGGEEDFERYYAPLKSMVDKYGLQGLDLDVEEETPLPVISHLIHRLRKDFGPAFLITMSPVATALLPDPKIPAHLRPPQAIVQGIRIPNPLHPTLPHLSGFSYPELENSEAGREIAWYNAQFYCGWGDATSTHWYDGIVSAGWKPERVVMGVVGNPSNGAGHVPITKLREVCAKLRDKYPASGEEEGGGAGGKGGFGGVMGWEYFNCGTETEDAKAISALELGNETTQAGWVAALGNVLRAQEPPKLESAKPAFNISPEQLRQMMAGMASGGASAGAQVPEPAPAPAPWPEDSIKMLTELGFGRQDAVQALQATDGDVELAAGFLFEHQ